VESQPLLTASDYLFASFWVVLVVLVPSLCRVVVLLLDCPVDGFDVELVLLAWPADGSVVDELVVF